LQKDFSEEKQTFHQPTSFSETYGSHIETWQGGASCTSDERIAIIARMAITTDDRLAIYEVIALHGHLMDAGEFDRLDELFTDDFVYDLEHLGYGQLQGAQAFVDAARALGDNNPLGHHVTNTVVIAEEDGGAIRVRSKGIGIRADGSSGTVVYEDLVRRTDQGWRIARRSVIPRSRPLQA
jgi:hypothetical protein